MKAVPHSQAAIHLAGIHKHYDKFHAVRGVDCTVPKGGILALVGPSGCGKTTILRLVAGLERPDAGYIQLHGCEVSSPQQLLPPHQRKLALVFQDLALWPHLTVEQHLRFALARQHKGVGEKKRISDLLAMVHLALPNRYPRQLSGGERQRLALARALAQDPEILLLDEPFSSLDHALRDELLYELRRLLKQSSMTVMYVTHSREEAAFLADQAAIMEQGHLIRQGAVDELLTPTAKPIAYPVSTATIPNTQLPLEERSRP